VDAGAFNVLEPPDSGGSRSRSSGFGVGCVLFRIGRDDSGWGVARGSRLRSDVMVESEAHVLDWGQFGVLSCPSCPLRCMSRAYCRLCVCAYAGDVGEGWAMELGDSWGPPPRDAVRCEDAATAAAEGSKEE
jgi:hypothetical protein